MQLVSSTMDSLHGALERLCSRFSIPVRYVQHPPTRSAAQTQSVLPKDVLVQKSVTGKLGKDKDHKIILWSGIGDYRLERSHGLQAARLLHVPDGRSQTLNPPEIDHSFYAVPDGTISPFLHPFAPACRFLDAIVLLPWPKEFSERCELSIAISLSPTESAVIPFHDRLTLLQAYQKEHFPTIPLLQLEQDGSPDTGPLSLLPRSVGAEQERNRCLSLA